MADTTYKTAADQSVLRRIDHLCHISLLLLLATGFFALVGTGKLEPVGILLVSAAFATRAVMLFRGSEWKLPRRWTSLLSVLYLSVFLLDCLLLSHNFVNSAVHLVLFVMVVKLFSVERDLDLLVLVILAFLEVLSATVLTVETSFLSAFCVFVVISIGTFIALEIRRSVANSYRSGTAQPAAPDWRQLYRALGAITVAQTVGVVICAGIIFFALPRLSSGYLGQLSQGSNVMTGFGDRIRLGQIGRIQQSSEVVLHVKFEGGVRPPELRLRGAALSNFDGQNWAAAPSSVPTPPGTQLLQFPLQGGNGDVRHFAASRRSRVVQYRVIMEPMGSNMIFLVSTPRALFGNLRQIAENFDQSVESLDADHVLASYSGIADLSQPSPDDLRRETGPVPASLPSRYLQLPLHLDRRVTELADEVMQDQHTTYDRALSVERYLSSHFAYTLELPSMTQRDPIANFLFERKRGHCEYFASAMAIMLRTQGIPSRVVTGFRGGEFNQYTGSYIVRARDAHAWVEAFVPGRGWATFDPTPMGSAIPAQWSKFQLYLDAANEFWRDWVVNYDYSQQRHLTNSTMVRTRHAGDRVRRFFGGIYPRLLAWARAVNRSVSLHPRHYELAGISVLAGLLLVPIGAQMGRWRRRSALLSEPGREPKRAATLLYEEMLRAAAAHGFQRRPEQTAAEFAASIVEPELRAAVAEFTRHFEGARYGESPADADLLPSLLDRVRQVRRTASAA